MAASRVALVTGSRKGIGKHLAQHLVELGFEVTGCSRQPADWTLAGYEHVLADIAEEAQVVSLLGELRRRHGRLDVLVNNAGIASMNSLLLTPGKTIEQILKTNVVGTALVSRESAKLMMKKKWGRIVNLSSVAVPLGLEGEAVYAASKGAIETFTRVLARELAPFEITVNAIGPSPIDTDLIGGVPREKIEGLIGRLAVKRLATPEDVANVMDFLLRPESGAVTGQTIYLGGP